MFIDSRNVEQRAVIETTICIIGAGVAGITLALEMDKHGIDTVLLESGGYKPDDATRDLYRGENVGIPYTYADGSRSRFLGGSSNCWGGWCRPLDSWDFEKRDWVTDSGWPFGLDELRPGLLGSRHRPRRRQASSAAERHHTRHDLAIQPTGAFRQGV
jgi:choline dehydrogenase-like flavoprotein